MSSPQNKIQVISVPETASDSIDATEAAQLVGYDPNETEKLMDDQYKLIQENEGGDTRPSYEHPIIRFASVALPLGALGGGATGSSHQRHSYSRKFRMSQKLRSHFGQKTQNAQAVND